MVLANCGKKNSISRVAAKYKVILSEKQKDRIKELNMHEYKIKKDTVSGYATLVKIK